LPVIRDSVDNAPDGIYQVLFIAVAMDQSRHFTLKSLSKTHNLQLSSRIEKTSSQSTLMNVSPFSANTSHFGKFAMKTGSSDVG
jgi:hypothetical protein